MKFKFFSFFAVLIAIFAFSSVSFAQDATTQDSPAVKGEKRMKRGGGRMHGGRHGGDRAGKMMMRMMSELNLSDAQKQQVNSIMENNKTATQPQRDELRQIWSNKQSGTTLTPEQETRARELSSQLRESGKKMHEDLLAVLTPEQRQQLDQKREEMRQRMMERRQMKQNGDAPTDPQF